MYIFFLYIIIDTDKISKYSQTTTTLKKLKKGGEKKQHSGSVRVGGHFIDELSYHFGFVYKWM